jgi:hypothetical protein
MKSLLFIVIVIEKVLSVKSIYFDTNCSMFLQETQIGTKIKPSPYAE